MIKTLKFRIKDKHAPILNEMARSVNFVFNYVNDLSSRIIKEKYRFPNYYELEKYTAKSGKFLNLHSQTVQCIVKEYVQRRIQFKKRILKWRKSGGSRKSLGWIPFNTKAVSLKHGQLYINGNYFKIWDSYGLSQYKFKNGSFNEDSRGRWYCNIVVEVKNEKPKGTGSIGIDLGFKDVATSSDGVILSNERFYRSMEGKLAVAQRANKKQRVKAIHAKIKNRRLDALHKFTTTLVQNNALIVVGDVSSTKLAKTKMAKSVYDAGWGIMKTLLEYKCAHADSIFMEVNERNTTRTCHSCKSLTGPQGLDGLRIRVWTCHVCGDTHERDINAAKNILAVGHDRLAVGSTAL
jgi:putative transposase